MKKKVIASLIISTMVFSLTACGAKETTGADTAADTTEAEGDTAVAATEEASEEADYVLDLIKNYEITYPVAIDLEQTTSSDSRTSKLNKMNYSEIAAEFCNKVSEAGYTPMIMGTVRTFVDFLEPESLETYPVWVSYYGYPQYYPYDFRMWQYSRTGKVDGVGTDVNLDISVKLK